MRLRNLIPWVVILLALGVAGLFAWMTAYPEAPWIDRARSWPVVGGLFARFREVYVPPPVATPAVEPGEGGVEVIWVPPDEPIDLSGLAAPLPATAVPEPVWLEPGMTLHREPNAGSPVLARVDRYTDLVPSAVQGSWYRVRYEGESGWVRVERPAVVPGEPPLGRAPRPPVPLPSPEPDERRLERALGILTDPRERTAGAYRMITDVAEGPGLELLDRAAARLEGAYVRRVGLTPVGEPAEAIVVFTREEAYRLFQRQEERLRGLPATGHAGHGLVALFTGNRSPEDTAATLVHELVHVVNRRALGPALPPWLDEGLAQDLAWCRLAPDGSPLLGTWGGTVRREGSLVITTNGLVALGEYRQHRGRGTTIPFAELFALDWEGFVGTGREVRYLEAGLWVRYLFEHHRDGFRRFLADTARGEPIGSERLLAALGASWQELEEGFGAAVMAPVPNPVPAAIER